MNLSYNFLAGHIPTHLEAMESLKSLDLSHNSLSGRVPASLSALGGLRFVNLSDNYLLGAGNAEMRGEKARVAVGSWAGWGEGLFSVPAFGISAGVSFYVSVVALCCSPLGRKYILLPPVKAQVADE